MQDVVYNVCRAWVVCVALVLQESKISPAISGRIAEEETDLL